MQRILTVLTNVRILTAEIGGTVSVLFIFAFVIYEAWHAFILPLFR
jgi:hypothetical protein